MKILQINKLYYPWIGGVEAVVKDISEGLNKKNGIKIEVLCCQPKGKRKIEFINGVKVYKSASLGMFWGMPVSFDFFVLFRKIYKKFDIINLHWPFPLGIIALFLFHQNKKIVITWHSDIVRQKYFDFILKPFIYFILKKADVIIVPTKFHIKYSKYISKKKFQHKIKIIPFGIDLNYYKEKSLKKEALKIKNKFNKKKIVLYVGRLSYYKGVKYLIRAIPFVLKKIKNFIVIIIGEGKEEKKLKALKEKLFLENVLFLKHLPLEKLKAYFLACDIFVLPSIYKSEAFGLVQLQAMLAKKPVINTYLNSGVPYVSLNKKTGITVKPKDEKDLSRAIVYLLKNDKLRKTYGDNAFKRVKKHFNLNIFLKKHQNLYKNILNK